MKNARVPAASLVDGVLSVNFREWSTVAKWYDLDLVVDMDEFGEPSGVEVIGLREVLGSAAVSGLAQITAGSSVRFSYDEDTDAAAIGVDIAGGSTVRSSVPCTGRAGLDVNGSWAVLEIRLPTAAV